MVEVLVLQGVGKEGACTHLNTFFSTIVYVHNAKSNPKLDMFCHSLQEMGISILSDLQRQRETILHSRDTLGTIDANIGRAREVLNTMSRRIMQNKVIMWGVIALLVGAIGLILWAKIS